MWARSRKGGHREGGIRLGARRKAKKAEGSGVRLKDNRQQHFGCPPFPLQAEAWRSYLRSWVASCMHHSPHTHILFSNSSLATPGRGWRAAAGPRGEGGVKASDCRMKGSLQEERDRPGWSVHRSTLYTVNPSDGFAVFLIRKASNVRFRHGLALNTLSSEQHYPFLSCQPAWHRLGQMQAQTVAHARVNAGQVHLPRTLGLLTTCDIQCGVRGHF